MGKQQLSKYETTNVSFNEVFDGEYELPQALINPPSTVLDLGANEGAFTAWALERWPDATIYAFEPIPENAALFRKNINGAKNVNFSELAIAFQDRVKMYYGKDNSGQASIFNFGDQLDKTVEVAAMPPNELPSCEFVKVDIEGSELNVIHHLDLSKTKVLVFEYHGVEDSQRICAYLEKHGFELVEQKVHSAHRGVIKFARPNTLVSVPESSQKPCKVFIGVPSFFHIDPHFHRCLLMTYGWLASQPEAPGAIHGIVEHSFGDSPNVGRSRNMMTRNFLESDCTDLLFIDSDIVFSIDQVKRILSHPEEVVGGVYYKKSQGVADACLNTIQNPIVKSNGLNQVNYIGTGFLRIKRIVFEKIIERWGDEIAYCPDGTSDLIEYNFWNLAMHTFDSDTLPVEEERVEKLMSKYKLSRQQIVKAIRTRWLSEDWWFCQKANELGFKVWADRRIALKHSGNVLYPLATQEQEIFGRNITYGTHTPVSADSQARIPTSPVSA